MVEMAKIEFSWVLLTEKSTMFDLLHRLGRLHSTPNYFSTATTYHIATTKNK